MPTQIDWCSKCAAAVYAEDCGCGCDCAEGQLKQLLARTRPTPARLVASPRAHVPVFSHLKAERVVNPFAPPLSRTAAVQAPQTELQRAQNMAGVFMRAEEDGAPPAPDFASDAALASLWSTEGTEEDIGPVASGEPNLEALWMGNVARETGMDPSAMPNLQSIWMNEIMTAQGTTVANRQDEITFDNDLDAEIATYPQGGRSARAFSVMAPPPRAPITGPRVQVGQSGRFAVMAESETVMTRTAARSQAFEQGRAQMGRPLPMVVPYTQRGGGSIQDFREARAQREAAAPAPRQSAFERTAEYASRPTAYQRLMSDD